MDLREKKLYKDTAILFIGNISTKFISFFLVPLYSYYLIPEEYGRFDIYLTLLSMLYVIVSLQAVESSFRFIQECTNEQERKVTVSNALLIAIIGCLIFGIVILLVAYAGTSFKYHKEFYIYTLTAILSNLFLQTLRGMNKTINYVVISSISAFSSAILNISFIVYCSLGGYSLLLTPIIVNIEIVILCLVFGKFYRFLSLKSIVIGEIKKQLAYALPLIPNALCVWLLGSLGRFILLLYYGEKEVGLLAFTLKFPQLLSLASSIFIMAWQVNLLQSYEEADRDTFASKIFYHYMKSIISLMIVAMPLLKIIIYFGMGKEYLSTWRYIPIFFIGVVLSSFSQFYNLGFYGAKKTKKVFYSSIYAIVIYAFSGILLAKDYYIYGIGIAYSISELIRWLYIRKNVREYLNIKIAWRKTIVELVLFISVVCSYYWLTWKIQVIIFFVATLIILIANRNLLKKLLCFSKGE